jgi:hypothetical protein
MTYRLEVLVEGGSDVPTVRELLKRKFKLEEDVHFRIHPHKGRGKLPKDILGKPDPKHQALLNQLPAKLRGLSYLGDDACVIVLIDADATPSDAFLEELNAFLIKLPRRPKNVVFHLAIEETESWFLADPNAVERAYPKAKLQKARQSRPDAIVGAWEILADCIGMNRSDVTGPDKYSWAEKIAPYLDFENPGSPSLRGFVQALTPYAVRGE